MCKSNILCVVLLNIITVFVSGFAGYCLYLKAYHWTFFPDWSKKHRNSINSVDIPVITFFCVFSIFVCVFVCVFVYHELRFELSLGHSKAEIY